MFELPLPRGYRPEFPLRYAGRDPESVSERVAGQTLTKAVLVNGKPKVVTVAFHDGVARCHGPRDVIHRLLGLHCDPTPFERRIGRDASLKPLIAGRRGLRIPQTASVFEGITWAIVGQQVNLTFAYRLRRVVIELAGVRTGKFIAHPDAAAVARLDYDDLTSRQFSRRKAEYLIDTARLIADGTLDAEGLVAPGVVRASRARSVPRPERAGDPRATPKTADEVFTTLMNLRGFGEWTAYYVMMRACGFLDCVPYGDSGLAAGLRRFFALDTRPDRKITETLMAPFAPYRSLATMHLWMTL